MSKRTYTMMTLTALALALFSFQATAKQKVTAKTVDFDRVKKVTQDPASRFYFPNLVKLYMSNTDTTMTLEDYRTLYYGYMYQEDYNPYRKSIYSDKVENLYYKKELSRAECDSIEKYADLSLGDNLFDFEQMTYYIYALKMKKKYTRHDVRLKKMGRLYEAIISSGEGTRENPWVVICPMHEYDVVNFLGYVATEQQNIDGKLDYIKVEPKEGSKIEGFYFDISRMLLEAKRKGYDE